MGPPAVPPLTPLVELKRMRGEISSWEDTIRSMTRTPSPSKTHFLTKDSNTRGFTAFEVDERLKTMDEKMAEMRELMDESIHDRKAHDEFMDAQKKRGLWPAWTTVCGRHANQRSGRSGGRAGSIAISE